MTKTHNEYFRRVYVRTVWGMKHRDPALIEEILSRPGNSLPREYLEAPYKTIVGEESSRKSCPECKAKLEVDEWVWSWGNYVSGRWHTVRHFCKACYPSIQRDLEVHREDCGCDFNLIGYRGETLPDWLILPSRDTCHANSV